MYSYTLDLILLLPCHSTPVLPQPHLAPRALRTRCTLLGLRSLSTSDPPELLWSSGHLTLNPSDLSQNSFYPCLASVPVTGPANVHQTGSQPACRTRHLRSPFTARPDSGRSTFMTTLPYGGRTIQGSRRQYCLYNWAIRQCIGLQNIQFSWVLR